MVARRAHNPKVISSSLVPATKKSRSEMSGFFYFRRMYCVYVLYSEKYDRIYIGETSNLIERFKSHNRLGKKGYTMRFRPWTVILTEFFDTRSEARTREKSLKQGQGRQWIKEKILPMYE